MSADSHTPLSRFGYDFGDDAHTTDEVEPDARFDAWIEEAATSINPPGLTPRAEMWDAIVSVKTPVIRHINTAPSRRRVIYLWPAAIAAALLAGAAFDRLLVRRDGRAPDRTVLVATNATPPVPVPVPTGGDSATPSRLYRLAAVQTLSQAEALLMAVRATNGAAQDPANSRQLGRWGREVLSSTRLLLDSPAGDDPQLRSLLNDLELVLVQVIALSGAPLDASERALIDRAMTDRDLLPRIRTAVPAGVSSAATE